MFRKEANGQILLYALLGSFIRAGIYLGSNLKAGLPAATLASAIEFLLWLPLTGVYVFALRWFVRRYRLWVVALSASACIVAFHTMEFSLHHATRTPHPVRSTIMSALYTVGATTVTAFILRAGSIYAAGKMLWKFSTARNCVPALCLVVMFMTNLTHGQTARTASTYRVDAKISVLRIISHTFEGVGSAYAAVRDGRLQFGAGSFPEKAHKINRFGYVEVNTSKTGDRYFGFMTTSNEHDEGDARKALRGISAGFVPYSILQGKSDASRIQWTKMKVTSQSFSWIELSKPLAAAREAIAESAQVQQSEAHHGDPAPTLLSAISRCMADAQATTCQSNIAWEGSNQTLAAAKKDDPDMAQRFVKLSLAKNPGSIRRLDGAIRNVKGRSKFKVWYDEQSPQLPLRIEYSPLGVLTLIFEADATVTVPKIE
ncbi:MAG TPA: hypothetical protein VMU07_00430 [Candidatus Paceibacterota bacterium]|nr:hypothetical protein [Candidatus Paceibacterota bacterium]